MTLPNQVNDDIHLLAEGASGTRRFTHGAESEGWPVWSPDGRWLAVTEGSVDTGSDVYLVSVDDPTTRIPIHRTPSTESGPRFSSDGGWLAFEADQRGTYHVYVVLFPDVGDRTSVSSIKGRFPRWTSSGNELLFWEDTTLMVATVRTEPRFAVEDIQPLFSVPALANADGDYAVTPDGERFLIRLGDPASLPREVHVVLNWFEELKRLVRN